jgi:hypothetical protein
MLAESISNHGKFAVLQRSFGQDKRFLSCFDQTTGFSNGGAFGTKLINSAETKGGETAVPGALHPAGGELSSI